MTALTALTLAGIAGGLPEASADNRLHEYRERQCRYQWLDPGIWTPKEERRTALCVLDRWPVAGGFPALDRVLDCESGWYRKAYNPAGPYVGLGQVADWSARYRTFKPAWWSLSPSWQNSRSMLTIVIRWIHMSGYSAWGCA